MTLKELLARRQPDSQYTGPVSGKDWVLALDLSEEQASAYEDYAVVAAGVHSIRALLHPGDHRAFHLPSGRSALRGPGLREFIIEADRILGDPFQDWALGFGQAHLPDLSDGVRYLWICLCNGCGETGQLRAYAECDQQGGPDDPSGIIIHLRQSARVAKPFLWGSASRSRSLTSIQQGG